MSPKRVVPIPEAMTQMNIGKSTLYNMFDNDTLHRVRLPGCRRVYVAVEEIEKLLSEAIENAV
jgi:hypothetical protein